MLFAGAMELKAQRPELAVEVVACKDSAFYQYFEVPDAIN